MAVFLLTKVKLHAGLSDKSRIPSYEKWPCGMFSVYEPALFSLQKTLVSPGVQVALGQILILPLSLSEPCFPYGK